MVFVKVTLMGDSIRATGCGRVVPHLLGENFEVGSRVTTVVCEIFA
ncbi:MAG: hypothetical protein J6S13_00315 [Clostridia bacterium]|nr:hypothetical protein [Clostridia bacterium]